MSAGDVKGTACVTGGNGYIASALIKMLLQKGYAVKTTVSNRGSSLWTLVCFGRYFFLDREYLEQR